ncbi:MAG: TniQ family protein, partial [Cyanobacteria bacterium J06600_6]
MGKKASKPTESIFSFEDEVKSNLSCQSQLLRTSAPYEDESLAGYLIRLCELNYYESPHWILDLGGYKGRRVLHFDRSLDEPTELSKLIDIEIKILRSKVFVATLKNNIISYGLYRKATSLCPSCLKESAYARKSWDYRITQTCPIHKCILVKLCPSCGEVIKWSRPNVTRCNCGFDFRRLTKRKATDIEIYFSLYLYGLYWQQELLNDIKAIYGKDNPIFCLEFNEFSRMSNFMYRSKAPVASKVHKDK